MTQVSSKTTEAPGRAPRAVYRLYDAEGALLYIGSSDNPEKRFARHRATQSWWPQVSRREVTWHPWRAAWGVEAAAIWEERPKHNVMSTQEYSAKASARQRANAETQRVKCRVAYRANKLRDAVARELEADGVNADLAVAAGMMAERAYKEASGAFPKGVDYPPMSYVEKRLALAAAAV